MSAVPPPEQAIQWLEEQLKALGRLRNANTRDGKFRQWRQNSLTVIQRIWPGDDDRSDHLRRVPFSPPVPKFDDRVAREHYERGCTEARGLLKMWIAEIKHAGVVVGAASGETAAVEPPELSEPLSLSHASGSALRPDDDDLVDLDLPPMEVKGRGIAAPAAQREVDLPKAAPATPRAAQREVDPPKAAPATPRAAQHPIPSGIRPRKKAPSTRTKGALKEMLGFSQPTTVASSAPKPAAPSAPRMNVPPTIAPAPPAAQVPTTTASPPAAQAPPMTEKRTPAASEKPSAPDNLANSIFEALAVAKADVVAAVAKTGDGDSQGPRHSEIVPFDSARVLAIVSLAAEIEQLGVPEANRPLVQLVLSNLARQLESGDVAWSTLQEAVMIVMAYPKLARRALPIFLQFLDVAA